MSINTLLSGEQIKELLGNELPADYVLNSIYEVENVLLLLKALDSKIDWFKELKKHRAEAIDAKVTDMEEKSDRLRAVVLHTMRKLQPESNTLNFPDIGSVTKKKNPDKWEVTAEEELLEFLSTTGHKNEVVKIKETIDSRKLKKALDDFSAANIEVPGATKIPGEEIVSIKFDSAKQKAIAANGNAPLLTQEVDNVLDGISMEDI